MILILILIVYLRRTGSSRMPTWFGEYGSCQPLSPYCPPTAPYCPHATDRPTDQPRRVFFSLPPPPLLSTRAFFLFFGVIVLIVTIDVASPAMFWPDLAFRPRTSLCPIIVARGSDQTTLTSRFEARDVRQRRRCFFGFLLFVGFWGSISHAFLTHFRHPIRAGSYSVSMCWVLIGVVLAI